jgi:hypothetical protein
MSLRSINRTAALLLILEGLLMFVPVGILGAAIGWPGILGEPAAVVLPTILANADATRLGYFVYLIYSILFWPVLLYVIRLVNPTQGALIPSLQVAAGFAAVSTLARCIGIIRWLVAMPVLAKLYAASGATPQTQEMLTIAYRTLNEFGGSIGEVLGVSLFAALAVLLVSSAILRYGMLPRWIGAFGLLTAASLFLPLLEVFGIDIGPLITASVAVLQLWLLAAGIALFFVTPKDKVAATY